MRPVCASSFSAGWRDLSTRLFHNNLPSPYTHGRPCGRGQVEFSWCIYVTSKKAGRQAPGLWELQSGVIFFRQRGRLPPRLEPLKRPSYSEDWNKKRHARSGGSSLSCLGARDLVSSHSALTRMNNFCAASGVEALSLTVTDWTSPTVLTFTSVAPVSSVQPVTKSVDVHTR